MTPTEITIPHGYKLVTGQLQKGDGLWNGKRFAKVKKTYPFIGTIDTPAIRRCDVVQTDLGSQVPCEEEAP